MMRKHEGFAQPLKPARLVRCNLIRWVRNEQITQTM
jgi:hypothetical protein